MAAELGVNERTARHWAAGDWLMQAEKWDRLVAIVRGHRDGLNVLLAELEARERDER